MDLERGFREKIWREDITCNFWKLQVFVHVTLKNTMSFIIKPKGLLE